ncbi:MAG: VOC family protein [Actinomycetota bacterium]
MSALRLSHILHRVTDLHRAVADAEADGFTVHWGSDPDVAHNALIWFETGPFLEFIAPPPFDESLAPRYEQVAGPGAVLRSRRWGAMDAGWCDVAVEVDAPDLEAVMRRCEEVEVAIGPSFEPSRTLPGGEKVSWHLAFPHDGDLPFVMGAYSTPQRPEAVHHANGATEITAITVAHPDPDGYGRLLTRYLGTAMPADIVVEAGDGDGAVITAVAAAGLTAEVRFGASVLVPSN